jgi:CarD family transcriptional regulator
MEKNLSFGERKMFDQAQRLLVEEIAVAKDTDETAVKAEIEAIFVNDAPEEDPKAKKGKGKGKKKK